jgi:FkbM family methyltransferase
MMSKIQEAHQIWRDEGALCLIQDTANYIYRQTAHWYYRQRGFQDITIEGVTAKFEASDQNEINMIRWMYRMEKDRVAQVIEELREDDVFFDIGANLGLYTTFASKKLGKGKVDSFEPYPPNVEVLKKNANRNGNNINIHEIALSNSQGTINFQQSDETVGSQVGAISPQGEDTVYEVETASVDGLISANEVPIPNVVKIDVEGAEPLVLEGMEETLEQNACRTVFCELHPPTNNARPSFQDFDSSAENLVDLFSSKGFNVRLFEPERGENYLIARKETK